jgi:hypothetical protein
MYRFWRAKAILASRIKKKNWNTDTEIMNPFKKTRLLA